MIAKNKAFVGRTASFVPSCFLRWCSASSSHLVEWLMPFASYSTFNQWSPCSVSPRSDLAVPYRRPCSGLVDAQRLSRLRCFLCWFSSIRDSLITWLIPFASVRYSTNGHRAVFRPILTRQCRIDTCALARWTQSAFRAFGVS